MKKNPERGINIQFMDGTSLKVTFPVATDDKYKRKLFIEEMLKKRMVIIETEGAIRFLPFENIKSLSMYPATAADAAEFGVIKGGQVID